jgi:MFS family permease
MHAGDRSEERAAGRVVIFTKADAGLIGTATLLTSAFGGWLAGALSDRLGRVRTLPITIGWFALFTFLRGFAQTYAQLFAFRALMGFGFGGEWAAAAVLVGEVIRAEHRGEAVGAMQSGWAIGWGIAALLATLFFTVLAPEVAWRALFWVGITPAAGAFHPPLRRRAGGVRADPAILVTPAADVRVKGRGADAGSGAASRARSPGSGPRRIRSGSALRATPATSVPPEACRSGRSFPCHAPCRHEAPPRRLPSMSSFAPRHPTHRRRFSSHHPRPLICRTML